MADARGKTVSVRVGATAADGRDAEFGAAGTTITFPGYRRVYVEGTDEGDAPAGDDERILPTLAVGRRPSRWARWTPNGHTTTPPARYTEASLVKRLEELGIGRPSTWAYIIQTILDRGYVWKKGQALVPDLDGVRRRQPHGAPLRRPRRLRLHRPPRGRPRRHRPQRGRARRRGCRASTSATTPSPG